MAFSEIALGVTDDDRKGDTLRTAAIKINGNDTHLTDKIAKEVIDRTEAVATCAKTNARNLFTGNIIHGYIEYSSPSVSPAFCSTSPYFWLSSITDITLGNPTGLTAGKNQKGFIVATSKITSVGSTWKHATTGAGESIGVYSGIEHTIYVYRYVQLNTSIVFISLLAGY